MLNAQINGIPCILFYEERVTSEKAPLGYPYMYHIRHDEDDWTCPIGIERFVCVNFFGTVFMNKPIELGLQGYMEIERFNLEGDQVKLTVDGSLFDKVLGL